MAVGHHDALCPQSLGLFALVVGHQPARGVHHAVPGHVVVTPRHRQAHPPRPAREPHRVGDAAVAGDTPRRDRAHATCTARSSGVTSETTTKPAGSCTVPTIASRRLRRARPPDRLLLPAHGRRRRAAHAQVLPFLPEFGVDVHVLAPEDSQVVRSRRGRWWRHPGDDHGAPLPVRRPRSSSQADALHGRERAGGGAAVEARYAYQRALMPDKAAPWMATAVPAGIGIVRARARST